jgi:transketolase
MIGIAAGLARAGFLPIAYGLSAFLPIRVLEQIKLDLCISKLPVLLLGDGAGLVYSTLGSSHQCGEDIAALRPMPGISIVSPADKFELEVVFRQAMKDPYCPTYLRLGKSDRPAVHDKVPTNSEWNHTLKSGSKVLVLGTGSMASSALQIAKSLKLDAMSVIQIKPFPKSLTSEILKYEKVFVIEEHHRAGGLYSAVTEELCETLALSPVGKPPRVYSASLKDQFARLCGSHDYALSEHELATPQIESFVSRHL